jgi:2-methylcitrate dehydratase PrpD
MDSEKLIFKSFGDAEIQELVEKITVTKDKEVEEYLVNNPTHFCATKVILETYDGNVYERWAPVPLGDAETPFGWDMLKLKFDNLVSGTPCEKTKDKRFDLLKNLEKANDINMLFRL